MIRIPLNEVVARIVEKTSLPEQEILLKIDAKCAQLSGLVSRDGAAHIIANELGVKLLEHGGRLKIKDIYAGMRSVEVLGKVTQVFEPKTFNRADGTAGKVGSFLIGDETGNIKVVAWGSQADALINLNNESTVLVSTAVAKENARGFKEIHLNDNSKLIINPKGEIITEVKQKPTASRKTIKELQENDANVEVLGTIVQIFDPRFFEVCPSCNKRIREFEGKYNCEAHGAVEPTYSYVFNVFLDDGTDNIRVVFFKNQMEHLLNKAYDQMMLYRSMPDKFEAVKTELLGNVIKITGRAVKNNFFDKLELIAQTVVPANAEEEVAKMNEQKQE